MHKVTVEKRALFEVFMIIAIILAIKLVSKFGIDIFNRLAKF